MSVKHKMQKASVGFGAAFTECSTEKESESPQGSERPPKVAQRGCVRRSSAITKKCPRCIAQRGIPLSFILQFRENTRPSQRALSNFAYRAAVFSSAVQTGEFKAVQQT
ncbi:hypothetical protein Anapl_05293 [Anas platyrhynchos]|uniref:Uncharacterized protein n=1 Tax=Anas platyrhynchos TaxID=8839 RepID=R0LTM4_ANAPL|nr:hypothetical protein Anapl_05293 [Anas platyrhynchos]